MAKNIPDIAPNNQFLTLYYCFAHDENMPNDMITDEV
jgi:hypothetical protein